MIAQLSVGFYEGWRPSRAEVADLIAVDLGLTTVDEAEDRVRQRRRHVFVPDITPDRFVQRRCRRIAHQKARLTIWTTMTRHGQLLPIKNDRSLMLCKRLTIH